MLDEMNLDEIQNLVYALTEAAEEEDRQNGNNNNNNNSLPWEEIRVK
jgi:hypothetical protein